MTNESLAGGHPRRRHRLALAVVVASALAAAAPSAASAHSWRGDSALRPGDLLVSRSVYDDNAANIQVGRRRCLRAARAVA